MNFKTITVLNTDGEPLNAAVLCVFSAVVIDRRFVIYSLNENLGGGLIRIYVASLSDDGDSLLMTCISPNDFKIAAQTLKDIISDALAPAPHMTDGSYRILDLLETRIIPGDVHTHRTLKVNETWVEKLLNFQPSPGPLVQTTLQTSTRDIHIELECTDYYSKLTPLSQYEDDNRQPPMSMLPSSPVASLISEMTNIAPSTALIASEETEPMTQNTVSRIQKNLQTIMVNLSSHKEALLIKHEELYSTRLAQERRDHDLSIREAMLDQREEELSKSTASLTIAEAQLGELIHLINDASPVAALFPKESD